MLKSDILVHYGSSEAVRWLKSTYHEIQDGRQRLNFKLLNCYNAAADCPTALKFRKRVHHGSTEVAELLICKSVYFVPHDYIP